jgi:hypothetical protein
MLALPVKGQKHCPKVASERLRTTKLKVYGDKVRHGITARVSEKIDSLPQARKEKVLAIRQKLNAGKYGINKRVNNYGFTPVALTSTGYACPTSSDTSIYGLTPIELRRNIKCGE